MGNRILYWILLILFSSLAFSDAKYLRIPNSLNVLLVSCSAAFSVLNSAQKPSLFAGIFLLSLFSFFHLKGGLGLADVKLSFSIGILFGFFTSIFVCIFSTLCAMLYGSWLSKFQGEQGSFQMKIPYASFLSMGCLMAMVKL